MSHNIGIDIGKYKGDKCYKSRFFRIPYRNNEGEIPYF